MMQPDAERYRKVELDQEAYLPEFRFSGGYKLS
jgi:hypothetical protein